VKRAWPHLRAAFVLFHVFAVVLMAIPAPGGGMNKSAWQDPTVQNEFATWTEVLNNIGVDITQVELEDHLWVLAQGYMKQRNAVLDPLRPYYRYTGSQQSWRMFVAPHIWPSRLRIDIQESGEWRTVYLARDPDLDWRERQFGHDRMRSAIFRFSWKQYRGSYNSFTRWVADRAAEDFPNASHVRCQLIKQQTASAERVLNDDLYPEKTMLVVTQGLESRR
jgi:hypothetical protein